MRRRQLEKLVVRRSNAGSEEVAVVVVADGGDALEVEVARRNGGAREEGREMRWQVLSKQKGRGWKGERGVKSRSWLLTFRRCKCLDASSTETVRFASELRSRPDRRVSFFIAPYRRSPTSGLKLIPRADPLDQPFRRLFVSSAFTLRSGLFQRPSRTLVAALAAPTRINSEVKMSSQPSNFRLLVLDDVLKSELVFWLRFSSLGGSYVIVESCKYLQL